MKDFKTVPQYIRSFPPAIRKELTLIRQTVRKLAPGASEKIAYGIPTFYLGKNLVHYAAFKTHIGFFPTSSGVKAFQKELKGYSTSRGTIRFPLGEKLPLGLIRKIVRYRIKEVRSSKIKKLTR